MQSVGYRVDPSDCYEVYIDGKCIYECFDLLDAIFLVSRLKEVLRVKCGEFTMHVKSDDGKEVYLLEQTNKVGGKK